MKNTSPLPHSIDAEQQVLGAILMDGTVVNEVIPILGTPDRFFQEQHQVIYGAVLNLFDRGVPCDVITISEELLRENKLDAAGGRVYLIELAQGTVSVSNVKFHSDIILEKYRLRAAIERMDGAIVECYNGGSDFSRISGKIQSVLDELHYMSSPDVTDIGKRLPDIITQIDESQKGRKEQGLDTPLDDLNLLVRFKPGQMALIAGRPSEGKTSLLLNLAEHVAYHRDLPVLFFSLEMTADELFLRQLFSKARVPSDRMLSGKILRDVDWQALVEAQGILAEKGSNLMVCDLPSLTVPQIRAVSSRYHSRRPLGMIAIDYMQLITPTEVRRNGTREQEVASIARALKQLSRELQVPVVVCSQLSRDVDKGEKRRAPRLSDLRESGALEQDADIVIFIHHPNEILYDISECELMVSKNRSGRTGKVQVMWHRDYVKFESLTRRTDGSHNIDENLGRAGVSDVTGNARGTLFDDEP